MANLHCPCGRPLQDSRAFFCPACLFNHCSQQHSHNQRYTGDRFTLPERPKSTSNSPPPSHHNWQHANPRKSMDSSAASTRPSSSSADHKPPSPLSRPRQTTQYSSSASTASISSSSSYSRQSSVSSASSARNNSVTGAYAPIAAGFARLSRKDNSLVGSETGLSRGGSPARSGMELEAARMFAGAA